MKKIYFPYILVLFVFIPQIAFADVIPPLPLKECAIKCIGCCGQKAAAPYSEDCSRRCRAGKDRIKDSCWQTEPCIACKECALKCAGCFGETPTGSASLCRECRHRKCNYEETCLQIKTEAMKDAQKTSKEAIWAAQRETTELELKDALNAKIEAEEQAQKEALGQAKVETEEQAKESESSNELPQKRSCSASPFSSDTNYWSLLLILMATVCIVSFGLAYRLGKR